MRCAWVGAILLVACSCSKAPVETSTSVQASTPAASKEQALYEQVRSGRYQINTALEPLEDAAKAAQSLVKRQQDKDTRAAVDKLHSLVDGAASVIADFSVAPPEFGEFVKQFDAQDDDRLAAIDACTKSLFQLKDASSLADDMLSSDPPADDKALLETVRSSLRDAADAVSDAKETLVGHAN